MRKGKDKIARERAHNAMIAWANLVASIVLTLRDTEVPNGHIHSFLDKIEESNEMTLWGREGAFAEDLISVIRTMVPDND